ncbi:MAG: riboflavin synthase [Myxococcales bacterium]|nr:riboflavin synthase [Myxococcales bacterium]
MFTGLVEDVGRLERCDRRSDAVVFSIASEVVGDEDLGLGDSVAVDGVCLTVTEFRKGHLQLLAGAETLRLTTLGGLHPGGKVNLERAVRVGSRLGGHIMQGHVDGVATMLSKRDMGANVGFTFQPPPELLRYIIAKGSIAIDGISLTVNRLEGTSFGVALIPYTVAKTSLGAKSVGQTVNIEVDMIGKYVESLLGGHLARD